MKTFLLFSFLLLSSVIFCQTPAKPERYDGMFCKGVGDVDYLRLIDESFAFFNPTPAVPNLTMVYKPDWDTFTEGAGWGAWWIQNSYGFSYCATPFLQEPWFSILQHSWDLFWENQGDGKHQGMFGSDPNGSVLYGLTGPDGCLGDCAAPGQIAFRQGDGDVNMHDWFYEATAAGVVMQAEILLVSRDMAAIGRYLPKMERACDFIEKTRDPKNNLFLVGPACNLLAPSYGGVKQADGSFGKGYLTGLSITYLAALDRMVELLRLSDDNDKLAEYSRRQRITRESLPLLLTPAGYFVKSIEPGGTKHGVLGQKQFGYLEGVANADAVGLRVVDMKTAESIYDQITSFHEIRPFDFLLTNAPGLDDTYRNWGKATGRGLDGFWSNGQWVNGGVWGTVEGRAILMYYRLGKFEDIRRSAIRAMKWAKDFRMDAPWSQFGENTSNPWSDKGNFRVGGVAVMIDNFAIPAATIRGLFDLDYRSDRLILRPRIPGSIREFSLKQPVRFGDKQIWLSCKNDGPKVISVKVNGALIDVISDEEVDLIYADLPKDASVEVTTGGSRPKEFATVAYPVVPALISPDKTTKPDRAELTESLKKPYATLSEMHRLLAGNHDSDYDRAFLAVALKSFDDYRVRAAMDPGPGYFRSITPQRRDGINRFYEQTALSMFNGLAKRMQNYAEKGDKRQKHLAELFSAAQVSSDNMTGSGNLASFPSSIEYDVRPYYRHRPDGRPGREILLRFKGSMFLGQGFIDVECAGSKESLTIDAKSGIDTFRLLLPPSAGVNQSCVADINLRSGTNKISCSVPVPQKRQWTVYIYPHSHVDIGYTNTQENVELIHRRNLLYGIDLAKRTADYPVGSRYVWNPEVLWPVERYLKRSGQIEQEAVKEAVEKGYLCLDAGYVHTNTSAAADEELFAFFNEFRKMEQITGKKIRTLVQIDVPGMSWGIVPVASQLGIKYCLAFNNGSDRVGLSTDLSFKPFWWLGQDGKSRILFLQPGSYDPGARLKGFDYWPLMAGQTDTTKLIRFVKTDNPRHNFIDKYLDEKLPMLESSDYYPYDIFVMSWAMADNTPIDADLPDAVKSWNEDYAFPHLVIAGATEIMSAFEKKYGDRLPVLRGDFTEYWTDGLGTAAKQTGMNRNSKERLIQSETLWSMLKPGREEPENILAEAWRNVIMGTEHTWCFMDPARQPITNDILCKKFGFFNKAGEMSKELITEALNDISDTSSQFIAVFNTLQYQRKGLVSIPADRCLNYNRVEDEYGKPVPCQKLSTGELVFMASGVPQFGSRKYLLKISGSALKGSMVSGNILDNGILHIVIDTATGDISELGLGKDEFASVNGNPGINSYRYLKGGDAPEKASGTSHTVISVKENGPLVATLSISSDADGCSGLIREVTLIAGEPYVGITDILEKQAVLTKEGVHFGFGFNISHPATHADIPWGIMEIEKDQLSAGNRNWIAFQRWLDISGEGKGITLCSLDAPVFESGKLTANVIGSATNSPEWIRKLVPSATIWSWALNNHWHTNFPLSQEGRIEFRYRILPHKSEYDPAASDRFGLEQAQPLIFASVKQNFKPERPLLTQPNGKIVVSVLKNSGNGSLSTIRLRSLSGTDEVTTLEWRDRKPSGQRVIYDSENIVDQKPGSPIMVPAKGFVTVNIRW